MRASKGPRRAGNRSPWVVVADVTRDSERGGWRIAWRCRGLDALNDPVTAWDEAGSAAATNPPDGLRVAARGGELETPARVRGGDRSAARSPRCTRPANAEGTGRAARANPTRQKPTTQPTTPQPEER